MTIEGIIFDLDGTLVDSLADIGESMNAVLEELGLPQHSMADYKRFVGDGMAMLVRRALPRGRDDAEAVERCVARLREVYAGRSTLKTRPYDGIPALLDGLVARGKVMAVLSNKRHEFTVSIVRELLPRWPFAVVFGERDGVPRKPDPSSALEIASALGMAPASILYVGDTPTDLATARAAGMVAVGAAWGFRSEAELREAGATAIARIPAEVLPLAG